jgi:hypothetical protein
MQLAKPVPRAGASTTFGVLGALEAVPDGGRLELPRSAKTRALLGYLLVEAGSLWCEHLASVLWETSEDGRGGLRWTLSKLRPLLAGLPGVTLKLARNIRALTAWPACWFARFAASGRRCFLRRLTRAARSRGVASRTTRYGLIWTCTVSWLGQSQCPWLPCSTQTPPWQGDAGRSVTTSRSWTTHPAAARDSPRTAAMRWGLRMGFSPQSRVGQKRVHPRARSQARVKTPHLSLVAKSHALVSSTTQVGVVDWAVGPTFPSGARGLVGFWSECTKDSTFPPGVPLLSKERCP